ncbi:MAG: PKD domain-containing protein, partial [Bacteroidota bacterium]
MKNSSRTTIPHALANMRVPLFSTLMLLVFQLAGPALYAQCEFTISNNAPCAGEVINFNVTSPSGSYSWDFDSDGNIDDFGDAATFFYPSNGTAIEKVYVTLYRDGVPCPIDSVNVLPIPDPQVGIPPGSGTLDGNEIQICQSGTITLSMYNASPSAATDVSYEIDWGDGSATDTYTPAQFSANSLVSHDYSAEGYYSIDVTATGVNGCTATESYTFYKGSDRPSVGLISPGASIGACAPQPYTFQITGTASNSDGTLYTIYISDSLVTTFTQSNVPSDYTVYFIETSCGVTTSTGSYDNAFDIKILAVNPCGSSQATIEPIEITTPPEADFIIDPPSAFCPEEPFVFTNNSTGINEINSSAGTCETNLAPTWTITPGSFGVDWNVTSGSLFGSDEIIVEFLQPGDYNVNMEIVSTACGAYDYDVDIHIVEPPMADAEVSILSNSVPGTTCADVTAEFTNRSTGEDIVTSWLVNPAGGVNFINSTNLTTQDLDLQFTEAGSYTVSLFATNVCGTDVWDTTIVVLDVPEIVISPIADACESTTVDFNAGNVNFDDNGGTFSSFSWSFPGATPSTSSDQYPTGISYSSPGTYNIEVTATNECGSFTTDIDLFIQAEGAVTLEADSTLCENEAAFTLNPNPTGGVWSGTGVNAAGVFTPGNASIGINTLTYTYQDGVCTIVETMDITVLALPVVEAGSSEDLCVDDAPFLLSGASPSGGTWSSDNGGVINASNFFDPTASGPNVYTLTYSFTDADGCTNTDTRTITVYDLPVVDAGVDQDICENPNDIPLTGYSPTGGTWSGTGVTAAGIFNASSTPGIGSYRLYYNYTHPSTRCINVDSITINVIANDVANAGINDTVCLNEPAFEILSGTPVGGSWSGPGVSTGNIFDPAVAGTGNHVLTYTYGAGVCQTNDTKIMRVKELPALVIISDQNICVDAPPLDLS